VSSIEEIAARVRTEYESPSGGPPAMAEFFGETVEVRHVPPLPMDGPIDGEVLRQVSTAEAAAVQRALQDVVHDDVHVEVDGNSIRVRTTSRATFTDGRTRELASDMVLEVVDGRIVTLESRQVSDEHASDMREVLAAGDFEVPAELWARDAG
jgi:hypothetical protein